MRNQGVMTCGDCFKTKVPSAANAIAIDGTTVIAEEMTDTEAIQRRSIDVGGEATALISPCAGDEYDEAP